MIGQTNWPMHALSEDPWRTHAAQEIGLLGLGQARQAGQLDSLTSEMRDGFRSIRSEMRDQHGELLQAISKAEPEKVEKDQSLTEKAATWKDLLKAASGFLKDLRNAFFSVTALWAAYMLITKRVDQGTMDILKGALRAWNGGN